MHIRKVARLNLPSKPAWSSRGIIPANTTAIDRRLRAIDAVWGGVPGKYRQHLVQVGKPLACRPLDIDSVHRVTPEPAADLIQVLSPSWYGPSTR